MKNIKVGSIVTVPTSLAFPGRRDPYLYEDGIVLEVTESAVLVRYFHTKTETAKEKRFNPAVVKAKKIYNPDYPATQRFLSWVEQQGVEV